MSTEFNYVVHSTFSRSLEKQYVIGDVTNLLWSLSNYYTISLPNTHYVVLVLRISLARKLEICIYLYSSQFFNKIRPVYKYEKIKKKAILIMLFSKGN